MKIKRLPCFRDELLKEKEYIAKFRRSSLALDYLRFTLHHSEMSGYSWPCVNKAQTELVKGLGVFGATSVVAGTMIGTAIFVVPGIMLQQVGTPAMVLVVWVAAGVLSLFGALSYAELGAALPEAGGEFVYMHRAYGPLFGFLYGWTQFIIAKTASIAAIATGFVLYLAYFFPRLHETLWGASCVWAATGWTCA